MPPAIPQFGTEFPGCNYPLRPGTYGVIRNSCGEVAVVLTPLGVFLPGGGRDAGESDEAALLREAAEECGLRIRITGSLGVADELVFGAEEQCHFRKRCKFFTAEPTGNAQAFGMEPDHQLAWLAVADAAARLRHESQRWALMVSQGSQWPTIR